MSDQPQHPEERRIISLSEVDAVVLRAWVDAGVLTAAEYDAAMRRSLTEDVEGISTGRSGAVFDIEVSAAISSDV